ncbi:MAG: sulfatase, partial [Candidatus Micrarchaeota archaeon]|nr:sulfatase [Candidatus Micrarchaeota archaeon]
RKDIIDLYGGEARMPNLRKLAKESMVYENAIAPSPWTYPSHVSLFTGMYLNEHGVYEREDARNITLNKYHERLEAERLAEYMKRRGYHTLAISNNIMISRFTGFDRGFDQFWSFDSTPWIKHREVEEARELGAGPLQVFLGLAKRGRYSDILRFGAVWAKARLIEQTALNYPLNKGVELTNSILYNTNLDQSFFLFLNFMEAHEPYKGYNERETMDNFTGRKKLGAGKIAYLKEQYVRSAEYLDEHLGNLIRMLEERGLYDNTLIVLTSDHGQAFGEHNFMYHGIYLYDEIVRVPLVIKYPRSRKFTKRKGYQSLTSVFGLIRNVIEGGDDKVLTTPTAVSESYGNTNRLPAAYADRAEYVSQRYEKKRIAVFEGGFKLTVNGTDGVIEEFIGAGTAKKSHPEGKRIGKMLAEAREIKKHESFKVPNSSV